MTSAWRELGVSYAKLGDRTNAEATMASLQAKATACADTCPAAAELKLAIDAINTVSVGSTSAAAQASWNPEHWHQLAEQVRRLP